MNVKVQHLISDIEGVVGMQMMRRIAQGITDPKLILQGLKTAALKHSPEEIEKSLEGIYKPSYLEILRKHLEAYDFYKKQMLDFEQLIETVLMKMLPLDQDQTKPVIENKKKASRKNQYKINIKSYLNKITGVDLTAVDGIDEICALHVISVTGTDMTKWKTADHYASWLNLAPRPKISGGKILGYQKRFTNNMATQALRLAAQTMWKNKGVLGQLYRRLSATKGSRKAIKAVACRLAKIIYHMLKNKTEFDPKKVSVDESKIQQMKIERLKREAIRLGLTLEKAA
jgi:transposase